MLKSKKSLREEVIVLKKKVEELTRFCSTSPSLAEQRQQQENLKRALNQRDAWFDKWDKLKKQSKEIYFYLRDEVPHFEGKDEVISKVLKLVNSGLIIDNFIGD